MNTKHAMLINMTKICKKASCSAASKGKTIGSLRLKTETDRHRATKLVETVSAAEDGTETATVVLHQRYIYRGYLQIAACDLAAEGTPCLWNILWDPSQPVATRPLAIQMGGTWHTYGWDLTKNVCELFDSAGSIAASYSYTPYGEVTASGTVAQSPRGLGGGMDKPERFAPEGRQPFQWSSEFYDSELALVYYNYRYFSAQIGRWTQFDGDVIMNNLYLYCSNTPIYAIDFLGLKVIERRHPREESPKGFASTANRDLLDVMNQALKIDYLCTSTGNKSKTILVTVASVEPPDWIIDLYWPVEGKKYKGFTANGIKTVINHEKKRLEVYKKAYNMYVEVVIENIKKTYYKEENTDKDESSARLNLDNYVQGYYQHAQDVAALYILNQQEMLSIEYKTSIRTNGLTDGSS